MKYVLWIPFWITVLGGMVFLGAHPKVLVYGFGILLAMAIVCTPLFLIGAKVIAKSAERDRAHAKKAAESATPAESRIAQLERRKRTLNQLRAEDKITKEQWLQETAKAQALIDALV